MKLLIPVLLLVMTASVINMISLPELVQSNQFYAKGEVGEISGIEINNTAFKFGRITENGWSTKDFDVGSPINAPVMVTIETTGNISEYLYFEETVFKLEAGEIKNIKVRFEADDIGVYEGIVTINYYR
jgi:hypothetical protein